MHEVERVKLNQQEYMYSCLVEMVKASIFLNLVKFYLKRFAKKNSILKFWGPHQITFHEDFISNYSGVL